MDDGRWTMDDGRWTMDEKQLTMNNPPPIHYSGISVFSVRAKALRPYVLTE